MSELLTIMRFAEVAKAYAEQVQEAGTLAAVADGILEAACALNERASKKKR